MDKQEEHRMGHRNFYDDFFERGHWWLKIRQVLVALLCWLIFIIPCYVTIMTYRAHLTHGRHGFFFWRYWEGFQEIDFLIVFLTFALGMIAVFCLAVGFIQNQRRHGLVEKWPMIDLDENQRKIDAAENFMTKRFGPAKKRHAVRYYVVQPEQNLTKNQLKTIIEKKAK
ncbi:ABC transporter permease [Limosilactobacillus sp.]|jgi:hypothetical protein|uniref:ABC transporter permease n=1 Tax=Limosilactobacillus sp. TaxID=2773925 RepID=UPI0035A039F5